MGHTVQHIVQLVLEMLGIDHKQQVYWVLLAYSAAFIVWVVRCRTHGWFFAALFAIMGLAVTLFLITESVDVRRGAVLTLAISIVIAFVWDAIRKSRSTAA